MDNIFKGAGVALVTPFTKEGKIDFVSLTKLVQLQMANGTDFLVVQGTTGESPVLSWTEKLQVLDHVIGVNDGHLKIVFGLGGNNTLEIGSKFKELPKGVDGILSVSPYYNKPTQKGIIAHYEYLAKQTDLPIILYNVPGRTGMNMTAETTLTLAKLPNVVAVKEASGDMGQIMEILRRKPGGFDVISGDDAITYPMITMGAAGVISVVNNAFPEMFNAMVHAALKEDLAIARKNHFELLPVTGMLFEEGNPGGVKVALQERAIMEPHMRLPLMPVSSELEARIKAETARLVNG